ncbi:ANTH domain-domain-containing protein [Syncephalastrum racemosum]|uniref:ANTH domain-domain-containing protein n=1 Tax=Syncephalastrum racemosum TaxID=13706 RepID=A0A1X2HBA7_SYNRA|nr:ANTH domain-domain-containing protein [Syncephalastrum racemosum]
MDTAVRKATRLEYQPPKQKHLTTLVTLTHQNPGNIDEIMRLLEKRLRENSWIIVFKVLIIMHTLMRDGSGDCAIAYVYSHPQALDTSHFKEKSSNAVHARNIRIYKEYLENKVRAYSENHIDYLKPAAEHKAGRLRHLSIGNGLLKETQVLQRQLASILRTQMEVDGSDNATSIYAYRLIVEDLLACFQTLNESIVNILEHYFEMKKDDARISLDIYKRFADQTEATTKYLDKARRLQGEIGITIPALKHAPLSLVTALEEYLNDPEANQPASTAPAETPKTGPSQQSSTTQTASQPKADLLDFFGSLDNEPVPNTSNNNGMFVSSPTALSQPTGFNMPMYTGSTVQPQTTGATNPFRSSTISGMPTGGFTSNYNTSMPGLQQPMATGSNPFRSSTLPAFSSSSTPSASSLSVNYQPQQQQQQQNSSFGLQPQMTGFSQPSSLYQQNTGSTGFMAPQMTGSTTVSNPFAQYVSQPLPQQQQQQPPQQQHQQQQQQQQQPFVNPMVATHATGGPNPFQSYSGF